MKSRNTFILLFLALAFGAYLFFYESKQALDEKQPHQSGPKRYLFEFPAEEATELLVALSDKPAVRVMREREGEAWQVESEGGKSYEADSAKVEDFIETLRGIQGTGLVEEGNVSLGNYGLAEPTGRVRVRGRKPGSESFWEHTLLLGAQTPIGSRRYVSEEGAQAVLLLEDYVVRQFEKSVSDFRPRKLLEFDPAQVRAIEIEHHQAGSLQIARSDGAWKATGSKGGPPLDQGKVDAFLEDLRMVRVSEFAGEQVGAGQKFGLDAPTRRYRLLGEGGGELAWLSVGNRKDGATGDFYVQVNGRAEAFLVAAYSLDRLPQSVADLERPEPPETTPPSQVEEAEPAKMPPLPSENDATPPGEGP